MPALCREGYAIRVLARSPEENVWLKRYPNVEIARGDIRDAAAVENAMAGCRSVVHAAGYFRFWGKERDFDATNVKGTENLMSAALAHGVERVIHISTIAVIGQPKPDQIIDETHPAQPADAYQRSKFRAEQVAMRHFTEQGLPVVILRPGAFYGPLGNYGFNRLFFKDPMRGIIMQVDGGHYIIFPVYIADVAQGIVKALCYGQPGEIYNICGETITHREAFDIVCEEADLHFPRLPIPGWMGITVSRIMTAASNFIDREPFWPINLRSYVYNDWRVSSEKARRELGFEPTDFRTGARRTIAWYQAKQPEWISEVDC